MYMSILYCTITFELQQNIDSRYVLVKVYLFINFELSSASRLGDDAVRQKKVAIQNIREVIETGGGIIKPPK